MASGKSLLERFDAIIEKNFSNPAFSIDDACRELGTSRSQLFRAIKSETNLSTSLYVRKRKLEKAKELLRTSDMKTSEIAYHVGIDSPQNFSKYFSHEFGLTPTAFRKETNTTGPEMVEAVEVLPSALPPKSKQRYRAIAAIVVILIAAISIYAFLNRAEKPMKNEFGFAGNSIAIIPFKNLGSDKTAFYSGGIAEQIHASLSMNEELKVISTTSSDRYKNSNKPISEIAKELDVNYILEGSVLQDKSNIRINVGLVRAQDDRRIWAKTYDGSDEEMFSFLSEVSTELAKELGQKLSAETSRRITKGPTSSPAAYKEYLQGTQLILSREKDRLNESVIKFKNAIEFDPEFADAYAYLGNAYQLLGAAAFIDEQLSFKLAEENSLKAIRLDTENSLAYSTLANIYQAQYKWEQALTAHQIALKLNPNDAMTNYWYSLLLRTTGEIQEATRYSSKAVELNPLHHVIYGGNIANFIYAGQLDKAREYIENGKVLFDNSWVYYWEVAIYYDKIKEHDLALKNIAKSIELGPNIRITKYYRAFYQGRSGKVKDVNAFLESIPDVPEYYVARAAAHAGLGEQETSIAFLEKAADAGILMTDIKVSSITDIHRNDPRFKAILKKFDLHQ